MQECKSKIKNKNKLIRDSAAATFPKANAKTLVNKPRFGFILSSFSASASSSSSSFFFLLFSLLFTLYSFLLSLFSLANEAATIDAALLRGER
jgi:hypothetical protein